MLLSILTLNIFTESFKAGLKDYIAHVHEAKIIFPDF